MAEDPFAEFGRAAEKASKIKPPRKAPGQRAQAAYERGRQFRERIRAWARRRP